MGFGRDECWSDWTEEDGGNFEYWTGKDGTMYSVEQMKTSHINNCVRRIESNNFNSRWLDQYGDEWLAVFNRELISRKTQ